MSTNKKKAPPADSVTGDALETQAAVAQSVSRGRATST